MSKSYICGVCGQEVNKYKDQCPYCKADGENLIEMSYSSEYAEEEYFIDEEYDYDSYLFGLDDFSD